MGYRKSGRPKKHIGLSQPMEALNEDVRKVQSQSTQGGTVLPDSHNSDAEGNGTVGVFATAKRGDSGRPTETGKSTLSDSPNAEEIRNVNRTFTDLLWKIARETAAPMYQEGDEPVTNLEALARAVFDTALRNGLQSQQARNLVVERLEGKAVRGERPSVADTVVDDALDNAEAALIESLTKEQTNGPAISGGDASNRED